MRTPRDPTEAHNCSNPNTVGPAEGSSRRAQSKLQSQAELQRSGKCGQSRDPARARDPYGGTGRSSIVLNVEQVKRVGPELDVPSCIGAEREFFEHREIHGFQWRAAQHVTSEVSVAESGNGERRRVEPRSIGRSAQVRVADQ